jgi:hypothetical protein
VVGQPAFNHSVKLAYVYTIAGQLKSITDSSTTLANYHGSTVSYNYDPAGRLQDVNGSGYANVSQYASGFTYRAWGAAKSFSYANGLTFARQYDSRMRISEYTIGGRTPTAQNGNAPAIVMKSDFQYYDDSRIRYTHDQVDTKFDTAYTYDLAGRLNVGYSGSEAYDFFHGTNSGTQTGAYKQTYSHDAWNNLIGRNGNYWGYADSYGASYNNQNRGLGWQYDGDGNVTQDSSRIYSIDGAGDIWDQVDDNEGEMTQIYDGDGHRIGSYQGWICRPNFTCTRGKYYLHSSVLGGATISEIAYDGINFLESAGYVYANGELIGQQSGGYAPIRWTHLNPVTGSYQTTDQYQSSSPEANLDPAGVNVGFAPPPPPTGSFLIDGDERAFLAISNAFAGQHQCFLNGLAVDNCAMVLGLLQSGAASFAPWHTAMVSVYQGQTTLALWHSYQDGYEGFVPVTANYIGNGNFNPIGSGGPPHLRRDTFRDTNFAIVNGVRTGETQLAASDPQSSRRIDESLRGLIDGPDGFPCPPSLQDILNGKYGSSVSKVLNSVWELAKQNNREEGGWVYMSKTGKFKAVHKDRNTMWDYGDTQTQIVLGLPPRLKGWRVIGTFHSHDDESVPSEPIPWGNNRERPGDTGTQAEQGTPGMILGGTNGASSMAFSFYGPHRGFMYYGLPKRCQ